MKRLSVLAAGMLQATPGLAQGSDAEEASVLDSPDEVIVVTAQRREQAVKDVPVSLTVFNAEAIRNYQIDSLGDYVALSPNVGFSNNGNPIDVDLVIRGVANIGGEVNSIGTYVDDFNVSPLATSASYDANLYDIERIEVLRGPQGTAYGRNVLGGAVNVTTVKPSNEFGGYLSAEAASFDTYEARGSVNVPLANSVFVRATGFYEVSDGFIENVGGGTPDNDVQSFGGRLALRYQPDDSLTADVAVAYSDYEQGLPFAVPIGEAVPFFASVGVPLDPGGSYAEGIGFFPENDSFLNVNGDFQSGRELLLVTGRIEKDFGGVVGILNGGYIDNDTDLSGDVDLVAGDFFEDGTSTFDLKSHSIEARLQSDDWRDIFWSFGFLYAEDQTDNELFRFFQSDLNALFGLPDPLPPFIPDPIVIIDQTQQGKVRSFGVFADGEWRTMDDRLTFNGGVRWSRDEVSSSFKQRPILNPLTLSFSPQTLNEGEATFDTISARAAVTYALNNGVNVYAQYGRGTKPGGFNLGAIPLAAVNPAAATLLEYDREVLSNYEVGFKGSLFDNKLGFSLSAFYSDWEDLQFGVLVQDPAVVVNVISLTQNAGGAEAYGVEFDFAAELFEGFALNGGVGYLETEFDDGVQTINPDDSPIDISGNDLPFASNVMANVAAQYTWSPANNVNAFIRSEFSYRGDFFESVLNNDGSIFAGTVPVRSSVEGYETVNVRFGLETDAIRVVAYGENLSNDRQVIGLTGTDSIAGVAAALQARQYGVRLTYSFGGN